MSLDDLAEIPVIGTYLSSDLTTPAVGYFTFTPTVPVGVPADHTIVLPHPRRAQLVDGQLAITLLATDDPDLSVPFRWEVRQHLRGEPNRTWLIEVPADTSGSIDLTTTSPAVPADETVTYVQQAALTAETAARIAADEALTAALADLDTGGGGDGGDVAAEAAARAAADALLSTAISDEATARAAAVTAEAATRAAAVSSEAAARAAADALLATAVSDEATARAAADSTLSTAITAEATARAAAITAEAAARAAADATKADLVDGVIPTSQIPAIALTDFLGATASQAAMLALTGQRGDWTKRTDQHLTYVLAADDPTQLASWVALEYPTAPVTSVNGQSGTIVLAAADVGAASTGALADELTARAAAVSGEASARSAADALLSTAITDEATARAAAVTAEASARAAAVSGEAATRSSADSALSTAITDEATARAAAVTAEASARAAAVTAEASARSTADGLLLAKSDNLGSLTDPAASRTNLGLGTAATKNTGTTAGTVATGDDARFNSASMVASYKWGVSQ